MKFYNQFPNWCNITVEKVRHAPMITNTKKVPKTTRIFHRYFFHRYYFVYLTHSKKPYDVIKMGNFINYLRTSITITYLKIIKIEALLFFQNSTNLLRLFSEFVHIQCYCVTSGVIVAKGCTICNTFSWKINSEHNFCIRHCVVNFKDFRLAVCNARYS